ncbi:MAG: hypothetical protein JW841_17325 [Deltaproteobacteria bacterium]|nr:hypothetical protein [Deltaproteobacteria bacterium]
MATSPLYFFDLDDAPQLAAVDILDHVLYVTEQALLCTHCELVAGDEPQSANVKLWIADTIVEQMKAVRRSISAYRQVIAQDHE